MKIAANTAVMRDSPVVAPRAPNTVPDAPAPKPAPASAPLPRCNSTRPTMNSADSTCKIVRIDRNISFPPGSGACRGNDGEEFVGLERSTADQSAIHVRHREEFRSVRGLDAAAVLDAHEGGEFLA